jgi:hypothetical protein
MEPTLRQKVRDYFAATRFRRNLVRLPAFLLVRLPVMLPIIAVFAVAALSQCFFSWLEDGTQDIGDWLSERVPGGIEFREP